GPHPVLPPLLKPSTRLPSWDRFFDLLISSFLLCAEQFLQSCQAAMLERFHRSARFTQRGCHILDIPFLEKSQDKHLPLIGGQLHHCSAHPLFLMSHHDSFFRCGTRIRRFRILDRDDGQRCFPV